MVLFENVQATVIRYDDKKPYLEYNLSQQPTMHSQTVKEAYIEVVSGERFAVVVDLLSTFDFQSAPDVQIMCQVDGMNRVYACASKNDTLRRATLDKLLRTIDGKWMTCGMMFADLQLGMRS